MKFFTTPMTLNQKLALAAGLLGFLALFAGSPYTGNTATINVRELALMVEKEVDHVTVDDLADWIIKGKIDYRLIDLRAPKEYEEYHIPTSENVPITSLLDGRLMRNEKIILYSEGGVHSAQAWFLLKAQNFKSVYILRDGLEEWKDRILFPSVAENASPEAMREFEKAKAVSAFFGGTPRTAGAQEASAPQLVMPKLEMPAASAPAVLGKKKKKEGC